MVDNFTKLKLIYVTLWIQECCECRTVTPCECQYSNFQSGKVGGKRKKKLVYKNPRVTRKSWKDIPTVDICQHHDQLGFLIIIPFIV